MASAATDHDRPSSPTGYGPRESPEDRQHGGTSNASPDTIAADIAALRSLIFAAAKHFNVPVNPDLQPALQTKIDLDSIKFTDDGYDEEETIKRHIALLPSQSLLASPDSWDRRFDVPPPWPRAEFPPRDWPESTEGLQAVINWRIPWGESGALEHAAEFGYDADGYPCLLETEWNRAQKPRGYSSSSLSVGDLTFKEHTYVRDRSHPRPIPSWKDQRFGTEWCFHLRPLMGHNDPSHLALALCRLMEGDALSQAQPHGTESRPLAPAFWFVTLFRDSWRLRPLTTRLLKQPPQRPSLLGSRSLVFQYHMRLLGAHAFVADGLHGLRPLPFLKRQHGWASLDFGRLRLWVAEARMSVAVRTTCDLDLPVFSLVTMTDVDPSVNTGGLDAEARWEDAGIRPAIRSAGISAFAFRVHELCSEWERQWNLALAVLEQSLGVTLSQILSPEKRRWILYDDSELTLSELYFFISQVLRFAVRWIRQSGEDLRAVVQNIEENHFSPEAKERNPHASFLPDSPEAQKAAMEQRLADDLLDRIANMQVEVKSLRDGLFTATGVSEAKKSKQLNNYIFVFTVVTIFYLPLSFVAALYALDLFSWDDPNQKVSFVVTLILVAGTTYGAAGYVIWFVRKPWRRQIWRRARTKPKRVVEQIKRRFGGDTDDEERQHGDEFPDNLDDWL